MPGRVLNFLEFSDKYSDTSNEPVSVDDITNASSNFEEGFDDETYNQPQIGPNRPVSGEYDMTPAMPGETGAPDFSMENTSDMGAPSDDDTNIIDNTEEEEEEEGTEDNEDTEEEPADDGNPESGLSPKKKVEEGFVLIKGFTQFINEEYGDYPNLDMQRSDNTDDKFAEDVCSKCGEEPLLNEYGTSCGCNM